jgi:CHAT domain-containing protein/tetratricopeptide (TPR) repeat protein
MSFANKRLSLNRDLKHPLQHLPVMCSKYDLQTKLPKFFLTIGLCLTILICSSHVSAQSEASLFEAKIPTYVDSLRHYKSTKNVDASSILLAQILPEYERFKSEIRIESRLQFLESSTIGLYIMKDYKGVVIHGREAIALQQAETKMGKTYSALDQVYFIHDLGRAYRMLEHSDSALYFANLGYQLMRADTSLHKHKLYPSSIALLANVYADQGDVLKSIEYTKLASTFFEKTNPFNYHILTANLGNSYSTIGEYELSLEYYIKSKDVLSKLEPTYEEQLLALAPIPFLYFSLERLTEAIAFSDSVIAIVPKCKYSPDIRIVECKAYYEKARALIDLDRIKEARFCFDQSLKIARQAQFAEVELFQSITTYVQFCLDQKEYVQAVTLAEEGIALLEPKPGAQLLSYSFLETLHGQLSLAKAKLFLQNKIEADRVASTKAADRAKALEIERKSASKRTTSLEFSALKAENSPMRYVFSGYLTLFEATKDSTYLHILIETVETFKAIQLKSNLRKHDLAASFGVDPVLLKKETQLALAIKQLEQIALEQTGDSLATTQAAIVSNLEQTKELQTAIGYLYPEYHNRVYEMTTSSFQALQSAIMPDESILIYIGGYSEVIGCHLEHTSFQCKVLGSKTELNDQIGLLKSGISAYYTSKIHTDSLQAASLQNYSQSAQALYQYLIKPFDVQLKHKLTIIPESSISGIPFNALLKTKPKRLSDLHKFDYLIRHYNITWASSLELRQTMQRNGQNTATLTCKWAGFAPFASNASAAYPILPSSAQVITIAKLMQGESYINENVTTNQLNLACHQCNIVHISTHAELAKQVDQSNFMLLANDEKLYTEEIYYFQAKSRLAFLSACETGLGKATATEGFMSLARAFAVAGVPCIVSSLWKVDDAQSEHVTSHFYHQLNAGNSVAESIRAAQLEFLARGGSAAHPFFWAGFAPSGYTDLRLIAKR